MCGIIGIISQEEPVASRLTRGLRHLEYRGYDSVGLATLDDAQLTVRKDAGRVDTVAEALQFEQTPGSLGIAHCRWGTHGGITQTNAHPHVSQDGRVALVHNGIIDNQLDLREQLSKQGITFTSETDSEVVAQLIATHLTPGTSLADAVRQATRQLTGSWALAVISPEHPGQMVVTRHESPLVIGFGENEHLIASDISALLPWTRTIARLENHQTAILRPDSCNILDADGQPAHLTQELIDWDAEAAEKGGYHHFMLKEIFEQPARLVATLNDHLDGNTVQLSHGLSDDILREINQVIFLACGTSWHAGIVGEFLLEELAGVQSFTHIASEFRYRHTPVGPNTLVIGISQSGETADTNAALEKARANGARTLAICNVRDAAMTRICDAALYTQAGPEIGVASTKAFTTQLMVLHLLTLDIARARKSLTPEQLHNHIEAMRQVPLQIESVLDQNDAIRQIGKQLTSRQHCLFLGRGVHYPIALEGALKLKEISYIHAEGYPAAEMKHGPIALIDSAMPVIVLAPADKLTYEKTLGNIQEVKTRGAQVIAVATEGDTTLPQLADHTLFIPPTHYSTSALLSIIPLQLLSYHIAELRGCDVDKPRNLSKVVTVE